ncbi:nitrate reductase molybdenum cofactor assembly chaperone [Pontibacterium granulatum]|uniref:nitrate reductase molybdenum cofactor assembly chaperone n=1 Tax=Pontibacterium granulatum TaxID=2036029 RepID=UPI00249A9281|nr:nitrate reductase molybdenum cofactor assembly chaperone [Pontibacterium granulatum]MDI3326420.1 nitrate reductase molybdenum cofactor assembly chaperone [Pontibacterium granulatum]
MRNLKILSALMDYPEAELLEGRQELIAELRNDAFLAAEQKEALIEFVDQLCTSDLLDAQEEYVALFDRGRSNSLLLFEHVHGESRDRGQAMVDLMSVYEKQGFVIDQRELPDYIPLFLEFLSLRPEQEVRQWLMDVSHILALLEARLQQRESHYAVLFEVLLSLIGVEVERAELKEKVATEERDDTPEALDKVWEEEMVRFTEGSAQDGAAGCGDSLLNQRRQELNAPDIAKPVHLAPMSGQPSQKPTQRVTGS